MGSRRLFIASSISSAALAACAGNALFPKNSNGLPGLNGDALHRGTTPAGTCPLTFVNNSNQATKGIYMVCYGLDPKTNKPLYVVDATGKTATPPISGTASTKFAISLGSATEFVLPQLLAARIYISFGKPLSLTASSAGIIPPVAFNAKDPNYNTPWDFFEYTYIPFAGAPGGNFGLNLSTVQSCNIPMDFRLVGQQPGTNKPKNYLRGWNSGGYSAFIKAMEANADFKGLILPGTSNRVLAPGTAITAFDQGQIPKKIMSETYFDAYVEAVWDRFSKQTLTFVGDPPPGGNEFITWNGNVVNNQFVFTPVSPDLQLKPIFFKVPTTNDLFENTVFCAKNCGTGGDLQENYMLQIFGTLCAAFNRSVMLTVTQLANAANSAWCLDTKSFYQYATTNYYSKFVHENMNEGLAYAFQSDDHCNQSSFEQVNNPKLTITLHAS